MTCPVCGFDAADGSIFCSRCGTRLSAIGGEEERRVVTALFCDLVGSTSLRERTDPEELHRLLDRYYALASEAVARHGGTVEKFIGDAVVALFGFPVAHEDDPARALAASLEIVEQVRASGLGVEVRLGVNSGEAFLRLDPARARPHRVTVAACKGAVRRALKRSKIARWYAVHTHAMHGGMLWILGMRRAADRAFAEAEALAARYEWSGALAEATAWVTHCCEEAGVEVPARLQADPAEAEPPRVEVPGARS